MTTYIADGPFISQRGSVLAAIVALHVLVVYAMSTGLARQVIEVVAPPIQTEIIEKIEEREAPPPVAQPELTQPRIELPRPDITIEIPIETPTAITQVALVAKPTPRPAAPKAVPAPAPRQRVVLHANVGKNFPNPDDFYPPSSIRLAEQGAVRVKVCVGPNGKLVGPPAIAKTSGFVRLDEAAIKLARAGTYLAGSIDGVSVTECLQLPVRFHMKS